MNSYDPLTDSSDPVGIIIILIIIDELLDKIIKTPVRLKKYNSEDLLNSTFKSDLANNMYPTPLKPLSTNTINSTPSTQYKSISHLFEYLF